MKKSKSKFARRLAALGFEQVDGMFVSNNQRKKALREGKAPTPSFTMSKSDDGRFDLTLATDEKYQSWLAKGHIDLSDLGFRNTTTPEALNGFKVPTFQ
jgi:hypothetical protein